MGEQWSSHGRWSTWVAPSVCPSCRLSVVDFNTVTHTEHLVSSVSVNLMFSAFYMTLCEMCEGFFFFFWNLSRKRRAEVHSGSNMSPDQFLAASRPSLWPARLSEECQPRRSAGGAADLRGCHSPAFPWQRGDHEQLETLRQINNETPGFEGWFMVQSGGGPHLCLLQLTFLQPCPRWCSRPGGGRSVIHTQRATPRSSFINAGRAATQDWA